MLPLIWIIGLVLGIALLLIGSATHRDSFFGSGLVLVVAFSVCVIVWLALYAESCETVADLKIFAEAHNNNYRTIIELSKEVIAWPEVLDSEWYVQDATLGEYASILRAFTEEIYDYNRELGRLRDFNENRWIDLIFKDVPPDLEYFVLESVLEGD